MAIIIPKKGERAEWIRPFDVDGDVNKYNVPITPAVNSAPIQDPNLGVANINPREYIQVGMIGLNGNPVAISTYELQGSNNKNYEDTHRFLLKQGLYMPTPKIFMTHFKNVIEAKKGKRNLSYADGSQVSFFDVEALYQHLTTNEKNIFGRKDVGAWTWLNAGFNKGNLETVVEIGANRELTKLVVPLEAYLKKDCFASLDFNSQGLANSKSSNQNYLPGENVFFYYPRDGAVARFEANSDRADLDCVRYPTNSNPALGVFACAEGAASKN